MGGDEGQTASQTWPDGHSMATMSEPSSLGMYASGGQSHRGHRRCRLCRGM